MVRGCEGGLEGRGEEVGGVGWPLGWEVNVVDVEVAPAGAGGCRRGFGE